MSHKEILEKYDKEVQRQLIKALKGLDEDIQVLFLIGKSDEILNKS